jgi:hypothetical protein
MAADSSPAAQTLYVHQCFNSQAVQHHHVAKSADFIAQENIQEQEFV